MRPDSEQNKRLWIEFIWLWSVGQQGLPIIQLKFVNENAIQVAALFFSDRVFIGYGFYVFIQSGFVFGMQLFYCSRKGRGNQNG